MAIATFRGESSVSEIINKLFTKLTPLQREKAETALLKANPQLSNIRKLPKGTILHVPDLPELRAKTNRSLENPDDQVVKNLADALGDFNKLMQRQISTEQESVKQQDRLIKSAKFKKDISNAPELQALAKDATKALSTRSKNIAERQKNVEAAIKQAVKDLQEGLI
jgi:hypothetical protein